MMTSEVNKNVVIGGNDILSGLDLTQLTPQILTKMKKMLMKVMKSDEESNESNENDKNYESDESEDSFDNREQGNAMDEDNSTIREISFINTKEPEVEPEVEVK